MYTSERAVVTAIRELGVGWTIYPYDEPDRGVLGYCAAKGKQERVFQWSLFGQTLEPEVELVEATDLVAFLQAERPFIQLSDAPQARQLGFVSYRVAAEGRAIVRRTSLMSAKSLASHPRAVLMETHDKLLRYKNRVAAASAIKPYGRIRVWLMRVVRKFIPLR